MAEQERLSGEFGKLWQAKDFDKAIPCAERIIATYRHVLAEKPSGPEDEKAIPVVQERVCLLTAWLVYEQLRREQWAEALCWQRDLVVFQTQVYGKNDYRVADARGEAEYLELLGKLPPNESRELLLADQQVSKAWEIRGKGDVRGALHLADEALHTRLRLLGESNARTAATINLLGLLHRNQGNYARAEPLLRQAMEIRKKVLGENHPDYARSLNELALVYEDQEDYARAEPLYRQAMEITKKVLGENHSDYATGLNNMASLYKDQGDYARAEPLYRQALEITKKVLGENHPDYATSLNNMALLYTIQGDYARAEPLYRQALEIRKKVLGENHPDYALSLSNLARLYSDQGDYMRSESLMQRAMEILKKILGENHPDYALGLHSLATLYNAQGDYARAEPLFRQALEIRKKVLGENHSAYAYSLNNLAMLYKAQGDYARAESLQRQSLEIVKKAFGENHPHYAISLNNLAFLYRSQGDYARAEPLFQQAMKILRKAQGETGPDYARSVNNLAILYYYQGDYARAEPLCWQAAGITRKHLESVSIIQSERQQLAMLQAVRDHLDSYLSVALHGQNFADAAYAEMLAWKGIVFRRQRLTRVIGKAPELAPVFKELQGVVTRWALMVRATPTPKQEAHWREEVHRLTEEKERLETELSARSADYRQARKTIAPQEVQDALPTETALVDFLIIRIYIPADQAAGTKPRAEKHLLAAVVRKGQAVQLVDLGQVAPMEQSVETWRVAFGMLAEGAAAGRLLRERIWEPIESKLGGAKIVLVSPDGVLGRLPLGALPGKEPGKYLLEERTIALVPVPQLIPEIVSEQGRKQLQKKLLLLGNVDYNVASDKPEPETPGNPTRGFRAVRAESIEFPPLPATKTEIDAIGKLYTQGFGSEGITTLEEKQATKRAFRTEAARHQYLHVATHGFFAPASKRSALAVEPQELSRFAAPQQVAQAGGLHPGLLSGLVLAGANQAGKQQGLEALDADDGIATAEEIGTLNLEGVELVMLSACETGLGQTAGGEGLLGLQRAFQTASARTVVASLWEVDDDGTRTLMIEFYKNLWEKKLGKLEALRQAQLTMLREYDPKSGKLRGAGALSPVDPAKLAAAEKAGRPKPLSPFYWAAFVLSGDWR
jgi:CHAT domain-containing protein/tetratricopeptide (TPR) repeat protein